MPSFSSVEMHILNRLADEDWPFIRVLQSVKESLLEKCAITQEENLLSITPYGRKVLAFYDAIRQGNVKSKQSQCSGCGGC